MAEENRIEDETLSADANLLKKFEELKKNSVSKDEYNRVMELNAKLVESLSEHTETHHEDKPEEPKDLKKMSADLLDLENVTNLEYMKKSLEWRKEVIKQGHKDPWLATSDHTAPTPEEIANVEAVEKGVQACIDECNGNPKIFNALMQRMCGIE